MTEPMAPAEAVVLSESPWSLSRVGVATVYRLELRQRLRSRWWAVMIIVWLVVLTVLTGLIFLALIAGGGGSRGAGAIMFGVVTILVLSLASLVSPALSATSINGDRAHGVLAALQSTLLTPAELVIGKLLAAWTSAISLLAIAIPFLAWAFMLGGTTLGRLISTIVLIAMTLLVVCAIGVGCSALVSRTSASAAQTYLLVTLLGLGLPLLFVLTLPMVRGQDTRLRPQYDFSAYTPTASSTAVMPPCRMALSTEEVIHTEYTWWLLAATPYVVVADAAPAKHGLESDDPLATIRTSVRSARLGADGRAETCASNADDAQQIRARREQRDELPPAWPYGLAIDLGIGALFTAGAIRRLRTPAGKLPHDTRVA